LIGRYTRATQKWGRLSARRIERHRSPHLPRDRALLEAAGVQTDADRRVARYDPETLETSVPNLFLAGGVVSGRDLSPVFIENGRAHGEKIVRTLKERL
jgi:pyruvate/2-oxoglutarate dehydrogenase complex dihydrolipoamide dehydrogenase (E3) component